MQFFAISSKPEVSEDWCCPGSGDPTQPKVAEKDALRYLKTFFVSFVLK